MNAAQKSLYFREWGMARRWYIAHGLDPQQADAKRHALHRQALGRDKSSKDFNNGDLDAVLAAFRAVYDGGNLDAQLRSMAQAEERKATAMQLCLDACGELHQLGYAMLNTDEARRFYANSVIRKVTFKAPEACTDVDLNRALGVLRQHVLRMARKHPDRAAKIANPF
jgi:hypothetical protein